MTLLQLFLSEQSQPWITVGKDVQYYHDKVNNILYFQCSSSDSDWKYNFRFPRLAYKQAETTWYIHGGFKIVWDSAKEAIQQIIKENKGLSIVGYSHGGPLAAMAHEEYWFQYGEQPDTYIFGSPRFLYCRNSKKVISRFSTIHNIQNIGDIVTHLPLYCMGFRNVGNIEKIGSKLWFTGHNPEQYIGGLYV
jgi:hypothetical protein